LARALTAASQQLSLAFDFEPQPALLPPTQIEPTPHVSARLRRVTLAGEPHTFRLRRARRRTIGFQIDDEGLTVSAPRWVTLREIEAAIVEKERWIRTKLAEWREWRARRQPHEVRFVDGGALPYLGGQLTLRLRAEVDATRVIADPRELHVALPADAAEAQVKDAVQAWLQGEAKRVFADRLAVLGERIDVRCSSWTISSARSQWGSCTEDGRIRLNWRLIHFALPVIDYVIAHELAHLKELNHSPRFWNTVAQLLPGFEAARDEIKAVDLGALA
jgi:hypothetical protein